MTKPKTKSKSKSKPRLSPNGKRLGRPPKPVDPNAPRPPPKRPRGKPRRNPKAASKKVMVRIDLETAEALRSTFGSLGNALYHTYQGIKALRRKSAATILANLQAAEVWVGPELPTLLEDALGPPPVAPPLPDEDWILIASTLQRVADRLPEPDHHRRSPADLAAESDPRDRTRRDDRRIPPPTEAERLEAALRRLEAALGRSPRGDPVV